MRLQLGVIPYVDKQEAKAKVLLAFKSLGGRPNQTYTSLTQSNAYILSLSCSHTIIRNTNAILCSFPTSHAFCNCSKHCCLEIISSLLVLGSCLV